MALGVGPDSSGWVFGVVAGDEHEQWGGKDGASGEGVFGPAVCGPHSFQCPHMPPVLALTPAAEVHGYLGAGGGVWESEGFPFPGGSP